MSISAYKEVERSSTNTKCQKSWMIDAYRTLVNIEKGVYEEVVCKQKADELAIKFSLISQNINSKLTDYENTLFTKLFKVISQNLINYTLDGKIKHVHIVNKALQSFLELWR
jgi:hypothetical protein